MFEKFKNGGSVQLADMAEFHPAVTAWAGRIRGETRWVGLAAAYLVLQSVFPASSLRRTHKALAKMLGQCNARLSPEDMVRIPSFSEFVWLANSFLNDDGIRKALGNRELMFTELSEIGKCRKDLYSQGIRDPELSMLLAAMVVGRADNLDGRNGDKP